MKKVLLLIALIVTSYNVFAFTTQGVWRWRKDDGSETSATWRAAQNTPITIASTDSTLRLRIELYNNGSGGSLDNALFEDSLAGGPGWDTIRLAANSNAFQLVGTDAFVTDLEPTTHQLNGQSIPPYAFAAGKMIVATDKLPAQTVPSGRTTEFEYVFKPTANIQPNATYYFRVDAANYLIGYVFPSLTTASVLPVMITSFKVQADNNKALITWTTATEQNNSHYDVERSNDGKNYTVIATVRGSGNTSSHTYQVTDDKPSNGVNYYRIKQYDVDGKYQTSDVRPLQFALQNIKVNVYPNPSRGDINFTIQNYGGASLQATLTNLSGKMVHQEVINMNTSGSYKLHLINTLPAGIYILKLDGSTVSEKVKIVVQ